MGVEDIYIVSKKDKEQVGGYIRQIINVDKNSRGPRFEPCGTPNLIISRSEKTPLQQTHWRRLCKPPCGLHVAHSIHRPHKIFERFEHFHGRKDGHFGVTGHPVYGPCIHRSPVENRYHLFHCENCSAHFPADFPPTPIQPVVSRLVKTELVRTFL